jgi:hypothetical protein
VFFPHVYPRTKCMRRLPPGGTTTALGGSTIVGRHTEDRERVEAFARVSLRLRLTATTHARINLLPNRAPRVQGDDEFLHRVDGFREHAAMRQLDHRVVAMNGEPDVHARPRAPSDIAFRHHVTSVDDLAL